MCPPQLLIFRGPSPWTLQSKSASRFGQQGPFQKGSKSVGTRKTAEKIIQERTIGPQIIEPMPENCQCNGLNRSEARALVERDIFAHSGSA